MLKNLTHRCCSKTSGERVLQHYVWPASWLREAEPAAAASQHITLSQLMERAGQTAFTIFRKVYPKSRHWLILVGPGNNGGDGYVIARGAVQSGARVTVLAMPHTKPLPVEATHAQAAWRAIGGTDMDVTEGVAIPDDVDLVVDGLLGTGIRGAPRGLYAKLIERVNGLRVPRVAIDIPSGLNAETGEAAGACFAADHTVTFISLKPGLLTGQGRDYVGQLHYSALELDDWLREPQRVAQASCRRVGHEDLAQFFGRPRPAGSHKGMNGKVVVVGGDHGFGGAVIMAAGAALSAGAGLVRAVTRPEHVVPLLIRSPEVMAQGLATESAEELVSLLKNVFAWASVIAVGPGLGQGAFGHAAVTAALECAANRPELLLVLDADALNIVAEWRRSGGGPSLDRQYPNTILTPHPGEAARLLQCSVAEVEQDRFEAARRCAALLGGVCLLKGAGTVVCQHRPHTSADDAHDTASNAEFTIIDAGNAGMASGGMGDVLTGLVAGVAAQKLGDALDATCAAALAHGVAADLVVERVPGRGTRGLHATELLPHIATCINANARHASL